MNSDLKKNHRMKKLTRISVTVQVAQIVPTKVLKKNLKNTFSNGCRFFSARCDKKILNEKTEVRHIYGS